MSTLQTRKQNAVCVRRAYKRYGTKSNPYVILDGLNMTVPKGTMWVASFLKLLEEILLEKCKVVIIATTESFCNRNVRIFNQI